MKVTFAVDRTIGGRVYKSGTTHEIDPQVGRSLLVEGAVKQAPKESPKPEEKAVKKEADRG